MSLMENWIIQKKKTKQKNLKTKKQKTFGPDVLLQLCSSLQAAHI